MREQVEEMVSAMLDESGTVEHATVLGAVSNAFPDNPKGAREAAARYLLDKRRVSAKVVYAKGDGFTVTYSKVGAE